MRTTLTMTASFASSPGSHELVFSVIPSDDQPGSSESTRNQVPPAAATTIATTEASTTPNPKCVLKVTMRQACVHVAPSSRANGPDPGTSQAEARVQHH